MKKAKLRESAHYFRFPDVIGAQDRLDYLYWHPKFDDIINLLSSTVFEVDELASEQVSRTPLTSGKTPEDYVYPLRGIPFIGARNIRDNRVDLADCEYLDPDTHARQKSSRVTASDVLITMAGAIGRCAVYTESQEANINQAVARLQPNTANVDPQYISYYLNSRYGQIQFDRNRHDVNQPNINTTEIGRVRLIRPPKPKQEEIVKQLNIMEAQIVSDSKAITELSVEIGEVIPAKMKLALPTIENDFFVQFPEKSKDRLDFVWNRPVTEAIQEYLASNEAEMLVSLIDGELDYGINDYGKEVGTIPFVNVENLDLDGQINMDGIRYLDESLVPADKKLEVDDLVISRSRTVGTCAQVTSKEKGTTFGSYILRFRVKKEKTVDPTYLTNYINSEFGQAQVTYLQTGARDTARGGGNNINPTHLKELLVVTSDNPTTQNEIVTEIRAKVEQKHQLETALKAKLETYKGAFERLLQL